jgi:hypothetical protein
VRIIYRTSMAEQKQQKQKAGAKKSTKPSKSSKALSDWVAFVKKVQKQHNLSYKDAMVKASQLRKAGK